MPKYVSIPSLDPYFLPMLNPYEILEAGAYGGTMFKDQSLKLLEERYPKLLFANICKTEYEVGYNHFRAMPLDQHTSFFWWYFLHYNSPLGVSSLSKIANTEMITYWFKHIIRLWECSTDYASTDMWRQELMELAWDYRHPPNFNKTEIYARFKIHPDQPGQVI